MTGDAPEPAQRAQATTEQMTAMRDQVDQLVDEAARQGRQARDWARFWNTTHIVLGFPAAVLAAISGATGLASADLRVPAALLALISAGLSAGAGFLRSDVRAAANSNRKRGWRALEAEARLVQVQEAYADPPALYGALRRLLEQRKAVMANNSDSGPDPRPTDIAG
ncbi:hypothetical protein [Nocardia brasiliensis]|nr:hypothetical protein [Nocardia brasiliensis]OCF88374.1 hypothetical protein AW168_22065 [Nocardia brasiliensis]